MRGTPVLAVRRVFATPTSEWGIPKHVDYETMGKIPLSGTSPAMAPPRLNLPKLLTLLLPAVASGWRARVPCMVAMGSGTRVAPQRTLIERVASLEELAVAKATSKASVVHFHSLHCRRCRATRASFERLAREWSDAPSTRFFHVLVEDDATNQLAAEQGIDHLPAIRVYSSGGDAESQACEVSCAPRGTGLTRNFADLREAVQACIQACTACGRTGETPAEDVQVYATPTADLVYAALPVSLVYVLVDKLGGIEADLATGGLGI